MKSIGPRISDRHYEMLKALTKFFEGQRPAVERAIEETYAKYIQGEIEQCQANNTSASTS